MGRNSVLWKKLPLDVVEDLVYEVLEDPRPGRKITIDGTTYRFRRLTRSSKSGISFYFNHRSRVIRISNHWSSSGYPEVEALNGGVSWAQKDWHVSSGSKILWVRLDGRKHAFVGGVIEKRKLRLTAEDFWEVTWKKIVEFGL